MLAGKAQLRKSRGLIVCRWTLAKLDKDVLSYEPQPVCGSTCSGEYLYCDNEKRCLSRTKEACKKESPARHKRESRDAGLLVPQLPCETGTPLKGLKGDGRTNETSKAECQRILENERKVFVPDESKQEERKNMSLVNFGYVVLGIVLGVISLMLLRRW